MKILIISFYFEPDLCAGSFRASALVSAMLDRLPADAQIEVITTLPNRYNSFTTKASQLELRAKLKINRIAVPTHNSGMLGQSRAFIKFASEAIALSRNNEYDLIFATSSRLMTATLGAYISRKKKKPLYLDIRDIFVDTIIDILPRILGLALKPTLTILERWTIQRAMKVNLVSTGFLQYFRNAYPKQYLEFFTNGIDDEFIRNQPHDLAFPESNTLNIVYAGNIGESQGLHRIIPELAHRFADRMHFKIIGDGGRKRQLVSALKAMGCGNAEVLPPVKRDELIKIYQSADVLFLHLNDHEAFKKVLPSKLFEYGSLGKPIWAGIAGHAANFVQENISNAAIFSPCDADEAASAFERLEMVTRPRREFVDKFARANIMQRMAADVISIAYED
jgi:glycosyltransferase involved in cell wall biosynthesis